MRADLVGALAVVRAALGLPVVAVDSPLADAWATVETFCAVSLRVLATTNPSKVRSAAVTVEISALIKPF